MQLEVNYNTVGRTCSVRLYFAPLPAVTTPSDDSDSDRPILRKTSAIARNPFILPARLLLESGLALLQRSQHDRAAHMAQVMCHSGSTVMQSPPGPPLPSGYVVPHSTALPHRSSIVLPAGIPYAALSFGSASASRRTARYVST